jgi:hypothetical protein
MTVRRLLLALLRQVLSGRAGHHVYVDLGDQLPDAVRDELAAHTWTVDEVTAPYTDRFIVINARPRAAGPGR